MINEKPFDIVKQENEIDSLLKNKILELANNDLLNSEEEMVNFYKLYKEKCLKLEDLIDELNKVNSREIIEKLLNISKAVENKITLDNVIDITKDGKKFILIHYPAPSNEVRLVENHTDKDAKTLFEENKDADGLLNIEGFVNSMNVFENNIEPEKIEVKTYNVLEIFENENLKKIFTDEQLSMLNAVFDTMLLILAKGDKKRADVLKEDYIRINNYPIGLIKDFKNETGKDVFFSPTESLVILSVPEDPTKDQINSVLKDRNGKYKLTKVDEAVGYSYEENEENKENINDDNSPLNEENEEQELKNEELDDPNKKGPRLTFNNKRVLYRKNNN